MLAGELALAGVVVAVLERRPGQELSGSPPGGLHSRAIEILDQRGIAERFLAEGQTVQTTRIGETVLDISDFPTRHPYGLGLWQNHIERIMAEWVGELGVPIHHGHEVTCFAQDELHGDRLGSVGLLDPFLAPADLASAASGDVCPALAQASS